MLGHDFLVLLQTEQLLCLTQGSALVFQDRLELAASPGSSFSQYQPEVCSVAHIGL